MQRLGFLSIVPGRAIAWQSAPVPADVSPSASHVFIRYLDNNPLSGTMPIELGSLASMKQL